MPDIKAIWDSTIGKGIAALVGLSTIIGAFVTINGWIATDEELAASEAKLTNNINASEARIISEVRSESADIKLTLVEDMESRLDEFDYDISILEMKGDPVPEALRIKRNMLERRIQRLKNENNTTGDGT